jgi:hypothetical protein
MIGQHAIKIKTCFLLTERDKDNSRKQMKKHKPGKRQLQISPP